MPEISQKDYFEPTVDMEEVKKAVVSVF